MARTRKPKIPPKARPKAPARTPNPAPNAPSSKPAPPSFSLVDEARWASTHRSLAFNADQKLRFLRVDFVSAGHLEGSIKAPPVAPVSPAAPVSPVSPVSPTASAAMAEMALRSPSPSPSDGSSSEDEIVFKGRGNVPFKQTTAPSTAVASATPLPSNKTLRPGPVSLSTDKAPLLTVSTADTPAPASAPETSDPDSAPTPEKTDSDDESVVAHVFQERLRGQSPWMKNTTPWESKSKPGIGWLPTRDRPDMVSFLRGEHDRAAAAMEDYMANVREDIESQPAFAFSRRHLDLAASDSEEWRSEVRHDNEPVSRREQLGSSSEIDSDASHILDEGDEEDEEDEDEDDEDDEDDDDDDDNTMEKYDDARIARILQKQEELGLGSDEVVLFGGDELFDSPSSGQNAMSGFDRPRKRRQHRNQTTGGRPKPLHPSASAMADALAMDPYGGFDIMDTERPSLRPLKKGRRGQMPPELSDSELNEQLQSTWAADRAKKRVKKAERQELRKQGLLGRKGKAPNLSIKYDDGIHMDDIFEEIREFMSSAMQTLSLPPMAAHNRAVIHQMVNELGVKSKSRGDGPGRFTVLSKTLRTRTAEDFNALIGHKKYRYRFQQTSARGPDGKVFRPVVSYRDGETVGASAPELGPENRGRVLLEKMGWTKGTALGALDNKGILQPIAHTVKTGKAGLK